MNDYGIRPGTLFWLDPEKGFYPAATDVYNPNKPGNGNSNAGNAEFEGQLAWLKQTAFGMDIRLFYVNRPASSWTKCRWDDETSPEFYRISRFSNK